MSFHTYSMDTWKRTETFLYFKDSLNSEINMNYELDVTNLLLFVKEHHIKFHILMTYIVSKVINAHEEFRCGFDEEGNVGYWDEVHPMHVIFHQDTELCTQLCTKWNQDFQVFYQQFIKDVAYGEKVRGVMVPGTPPNIFHTSALPWIAYANVGMNITRKKNEVYLVPSICWGKFREVHGRFMMPMTMQVSHAIADGFHVSRFFLEVEELSLDYSHHTTDHRPSAL